MKVPRNNIRLIEDHDEALKVWREKEVRNLDLVHVDAHIDFGFHQVRPVKEILNQAKSLKELKRGLECNIAFGWYEKDLDKQTNIGNYIYPAMQEGIVKDFYWVIPGRLKEFEESAKSIRNIIKNLTQRTKRTQWAKQIKGGLVRTQLLGRDFIICTLEKLPVLRQNILLDIDTDFLVIDSILNADNTVNIGKRKPWILPEDLAEVLKKKTNQPEVITVAYSVNGGYTPIKYKHLGDEIAYHLAPEEFKGHFENNSRAAKYFNHFVSTGEKEYYQKAVRLNPTYRVNDNNYGPLYLDLRKFSLAKKELSKISRVDPKNPGCLLGLGNIALENKNFEKAKECFSSALDSRNGRLFIKAKNQSLFGLARAEFGLKNCKRAKEFLFRYQTLEPLQPYSYYLLGRVFEKEKEFLKAAMLYQDAIGLGFVGIEPILRLLRISRNLEESDAITKYLIIKYKEFKKGFLRAKRSSLKKGGRIKGLHNIEEKMAAIEKRLHNSNDNRTGLKR